MAEKGLTQDQWRKLAPYFAEIKSVQLNWAVKLGLLSEAEAAEVHESGYGCDLVLALERGRA